MDTNQPLAAPGKREAPAIDADLLERARAAAVDHPELDEVLSRLDRLGELDVEHHPAEFEAIHELLRSVLGGAD